MEPTLGVQKPVFWSECFCPSPGLNFLVFQMMGLNEVVSKMVVTF